jgi:hypothetical protein
MWEVRGYYGLASHPAQAVLVLESVDLTEPWANQAAFLAQQAQSVPGTVGDLLGPQTQVRGGQIGCDPVVAVVGPRSHSGPAPLAQSAMFHGKDSVLPVPRLSSYLVYANSLAGGPVLAVRKVFDGLVGLLGPLCCRTVEAGKA